MGKLNGRKNHIQKASLELSGRASLGFDFGCLPRIREATGRDEKKERTKDQFTHGAYTSTKPAAGQAVRMLGSYAERIK